MSQTCALVTFLTLMIVSITSFKRLIVPDKVYQKEVSLSVPNGVGISVNIVWRRLTNKVLNNRSIVVDPAYTVQLIEKYDGLYSFCNSSISDCHVDYVSYSCKYSIVNGSYQLNGTNATIDDLSIDSMYCLSMDTTYSIQQWIKAANGNLVLTTRNTATTSNYNTYAHWNRNKITLQSFDDSSALILSFSFFILQIIMLLMIAVRCNTYWSLSVLISALYFSTLSQAQTNLLCDTTDWKAVSGGWSTDTANCEFTNTEEYNISSTIWLSSYEGSSSQNVPNSSPLSGGTSSGSSGWIPHSNYVYDDFVINVNITIHSGSNAGIMLRAQSVTDTYAGGQYYFFGLSNGGTDKKDVLYSAKIDDGFTLLDTWEMTIDLDVMYKLTVSATNTEYRVYVDDRYLLRKTYTEYTSGSIGLRSSNGLATYSSMTIETSAPTAETASPTSRPTQAPTFPPTVLQMIDLEGSYLCIEGSTGGYFDESILNSLDECKNLCLYDYPHQCAMINYMQSNSQCLLFDKLCKLYPYQENDDANYIAFAVKKDECITYPIGWTDRFSNGCGDYSDFCDTSGVIDEDALTAIESRSNTVNGFNAAESCCECGGGIAKFDGVTMHSELVTVENFEPICTLKQALSVQLFRRWNNIHLYHLCKKATAQLSWDKCNLLLYEENHEFIRFYYCDIPENEHNLYFTFMMEIDNISLNSSTFYLNPYWFNLNESLLPRSQIIPILSYSACSALFSSISANTRLLINYPCNVTSQQENKTKEGILNIIKHLVNVSWASFISISTFIVFGGCFLIFLYINGNVTDYDEVTDSDEPPFYWFSCSMLFSFIHFILIIVAIGVIYDYNLQSYFNNLYETGCDDGTVISDSFDLQIQFQHFTNITLALLALLIPVQCITMCCVAYQSNVKCLWIIYSMMLINFILITVNCFGIIEPVYAQYSSIYNGDEYLCIPAPLNIQHIDYTLNPTMNPTIYPTINPSAMPTTQHPTDRPSFNPVYDPTISPTLSPTNIPTLPTLSPTNDPTLKPNNDPTVSPTHYPTLTPLNYPTLSPSNNPTLLPTTYPTLLPTKNPTASTVQPSCNPTDDPTTPPTPNPTVNTSSPTLHPTMPPSNMPTTSIGAAYQMIDVQGSYVCNDLSTHILESNQDTVEECKNLCLYSYTNECVMISYIGSSSKCYLFNKHCTISEDVQNDSISIHSDIGYYVSFLTKRYHCISYPTDWRDRLGNACSDYLNVLCTNSKVIDINALSVIRSRTNKANQLSADQVCCECGGGITYIDGISIHSDLTTLATYQPICTLNEILPIQTIREWDNAYLYGLCKIATKDVPSLDDCNSLIDIDAQNIDFLYCDLNNYDDAINDIYFIFMMDIENISSTIYLNTLWFNLTESVIPAKSIDILPYSECLTLAAMSTESQLFINYPCNASYTMSETVNECIFQESDQCRFSLSNSIFCCDHKFAHNVFVNDISNSTTKYISEYNQQNVFQNFQNIINLSLSSTIIITLIFLWMIISLIIMKRSENDHNDQQPKNDKDIKVTNQHQQQKDDETDKKKQKNECKPSTVKPTKKQQKKGWRNKNIEHWNCSEAQDWIKSLDLEETQKLKIIEVISKNNLKGKDLANCELTDFAEMLHTKRYDAVYMYSLLKTLRNIENNDNSEPSDVESIDQNIEIAIEQSQEAGWKHKNIELWSCLELQAWIKTLDLEEVEQHKLIEVISEHDTKGQDLPNCDIDIANLFQIKTYVAGYIYEELKCLRDELLLLQGWENKKVELWTCSELQDWIKTLDLTQTDQIKIISTISQHQKQGQDLTNCVAADIAELLQIKGYVAGYIHKELDLLKDTTTIIYAEGVEDETKNEQQTDSKSVHQNNNITQHSEQQNNNNVIPKDLDNKTPEAVIEKTLVHRILTLLSYLCGFGTIIGCSLCIASIIIIYHNGLQNHFNKLYDNQCYVANAISDIFDLQNQFNNLINTLWIQLGFYCVILLILIYLMVKKSMNSNLKYQKTVLCIFMMCYVSLLVNDIGFILPVWREYKSIYNDNDGLCYIASSNNEISINNLLTPLVISSLSITTIMFCFGISVIFMLTSSNEKAREARKRIDDKQWLTLLAVLMSACSGVGSIALTDALGLSDVHNGFVAIFTAATALILASIKIVLSLARNADNERNKSLMKRKAIALFMSTLTDSTFDFFQGTAAVLTEEYSDSVFAILVISTWIGVADELIECVVEIFMEASVSGDDTGCTLCGSIDFVFFGWTILEAAMGIYLLSTYQSIYLVTIGITVEVLIVIISVAFLIYFIKSKKKKIQTTKKNVEIELAASN